MDLMDPRSFSFHLMRWQVSDSCKMGNDHNDLSKLSDEFNREHPL